MIFKRGKFGFLLLGGMVLALALAACGGDTVSPTAAPTTTVPATTDTATTAATTTTPAANTTPAGTSSAAATGTPDLKSGTTAGPNGGLTMKAAFGLVDPVVKAWQADAVYISVSNPPDSPIGMDVQGRSLQWYFEALSPSTFKHSYWLVKSDPGGKAAPTKSIEDTLPKDRGQQMESRKLPPINGLIDTDKLMEVARENGGTSSDQPVGTRLARSGKEGDPLAFDLVFYKGEDVVRLRIDAETGKLVENVKG